MTNAETKSGTATPKKIRKTRKKMYMVQKKHEVVSVEDIQNHAVAELSRFDKDIQSITTGDVEQGVRELIESSRSVTWAPASEVDSFADGDKWILEHGEDGCEYRIAIVTDSVKIKTETITKRVVS